MNPILEDLKKIRKLFPPFVGFTLHPHLYADAMQKWREESKENALSYFGKPPVYCVSNQPCPIVKWTSYEQMMKFVRRKDREYANNQANK